MRVEQGRACLRVYHVAACPSAPRACSARHLTTASAVIPTPKGATEMSDRKDVLGAPIGASGAGLGDRATLCR